jgi:hypothetical protein
VVLPLAVVGSDRKKIFVLDTAYGITTGIISVDLGGRCVIFALLRDSCVPLAVAFRTSTTS